MNGSYGFAMPMYDYYEPDTNRFGAPLSMQAGSFYGAGGSLSSMYAIGGPRSVQFAAKIIF
jgi:hypothetical protein